MLPVESKANGPGAEPERVNPKRPGAVPSPQRTPPGNQAQLRTDDTGLFSDLAKGLGERCRVLEVPGNPGPPSLEGANARGPLQQQYSPVGALEKGGDDVHRLHADHANVTGRSVDSDHVSFTERVEVDPGDDRHARHERGAARPPASDDPPAKPPTEQCGGPWHRRLGGRYPPRATVLDRSEAEDGRRGSGLHGDTPELHGAAREARRRPRPLRLANAAGRSPG